MGTASLTSVSNAESVPEKLHEFKKLALVPNQYNIPEIAQKRQPTDRFFLFVFFLTVLVLSLLLIYTLMYSDVNRYLYGYDTCGNICGVKNEKLEEVNCSGQDFSNNRYLKFNSPQVQQELLLEDRECVLNCDDDYFFQDNRCFLSTVENLVFMEAREGGADDRSFLLEVWKNAFKAKDKILLINIISIVTSVFMVVLLRYVTAALIWSIIVVSYVTIFGFTMFCWHLFSQGETNSALSVLMTLILGLATCYLAATFNRIGLVVSIFREAMKSIFSMPSIIFVPILIFVVIVFTIAAHFFLTIHIITSGILTHVIDEFYVYVPNGIMIFTMVFFTFMLLWVLQLALACEIFIVSGAISAWYFSRDKNFLGQPILDSCRNLFKFHIGSVAFGSLILTVFEVICFILKSLSRNTKGKQCVSFCLKQSKHIFFYISKNAYIEIAMHGEGFYRSGKRATQLIFMNLSDVISINIIGDLVLYAIQIFIILITLIYGKFVFEGYNDETILLTIIFGVIPAAVLTHCILKLFKTTIDTILLCYCEDFELNDGVDYPYYMSDDLMQFIDETRNFMKPKDISEFAAISNDMTQYAFRILKQTAILNLDDSALCIPVPYLCKTIDPKKHLKQEISSSAANNLLVNS